MAAAQWKGGKCKSIQQAKAFFRHNDEERRKESQHSNPHIDKSKTHLNFSYKGLSYEELCNAFDKRLSEIDIGRQSSGKNARTVMQSIIIYAPKDLPEDKQRDWFMDAGKVCEAHFGKNFLDLKVDFDEQHEYMDHDTHEMVMSRNHGHLSTVPEVDGKLNGKAFASRANINKLNNALQEMSLTKYKVPMMDGTKRKGGKKVEDLKVQSEAAEILEKAKEDAQKAADAILDDAEGKSTTMLERAAGRYRGAKNLRDRCLETKEDLELALDEADDAIDELESLQAKYKQAKADLENDTPRREFLSSLKMDYNGKAMTGEAAFQLWMREREAEAERQAEAAKRKAESVRHRSRYDRSFDNMVSEIENYGRAQDTSLDFT